MLLMVIVLLKQIYQYLPNSVVHMIIKDTIMLGLDLNYIVVIVSLSMKWSKVRSLTSVSYVHLETIVQHLTLNSHQVYVLINVLKEKMVWFLVSIRKRMYYFVNVLFHTYGLLKRMKIEEYWKEVNLCLLRWHLVDAVN
jgi:hypothetical protein